MRKAFTLIEMMIAISILSIMIIFLYESYASLNISNKFYKKELHDIKSKQLKKRVLYLDFSLAFSGSIKTLNQDNKIDIIFLQSKNSMHKRYNPYIAYIIKNSKLYRLESLRKFSLFPLSIDTKFSAEYFGEIENFRVYKSKFDESYLLHVKFKSENDILLKIKSFE